VRSSIATNFQSRAFEEVFRRRGFALQTCGWVSVFYNRAEVKDALAYVRLAMHPEDDISLLRVLNVPPRGIGKTTVDALRESARVEGTPLWTAIEKFVSGAFGGPGGNSFAGVPGAHPQIAGCPCHPGTAGILCMPFLRNLDIWPCLRTATRRRM